ncbi:hypothetical protein L245_23900 [Salmonella enterica subsp. enterica serovar Worthington str. BCH-4719]|nr:hypothetical protein L245_23900 [Salmonella enterica subsp. enterica serovar Worthington str. BCH-4719]
MLPVCQPPAHSSNTFASYLHVHFAQRPEMLQHWLAAARRVL